MEITIKRRTWFLGSFMPVNLQFNDEKVATLTRNEQKVVSISKAEGQLKYNQPLDRSDQIHVKDGDIITLKDTVLSKMINILFLMSFILIITINVYVLFTGVYYESNGLRLFIIILLSVLLLLFIISFFFNSYKFVIEN